MLDFNVNFHASICIGGNIYIDPYHIKTQPKNAGFVLITHEHGDHFSVKDIKKVINENTIIVGGTNVVKGLAGEGIKNKTVDLGAIGKFGQVYSGQGVKITTFPAYNIDKFRSAGVPFHKKDVNFVGYVIETGDTKYCVCGDTDFTPELQAVKCDVLFVPIGGRFTMTAEEAAKCANAIKPKIAVPVHYQVRGVGGMFLGGRKAENTFKDNLSKDIECRTFI